MFDRIKKAFRVLLRAEHYDNAATTNENRRHWEKANEIAPIHANNPFTRKRLRERAQYEADNNCYCGGLVDTLAKDVVGYTLPALQCLSRDSAMNRMIEDEFNQWAKSSAVNLHNKLYVAHSGRVIEGENFLVFTSDSFETLRDTGYALNLNVVPQSRVTDFTGFAGWEQVFTRVVTDAYGTQHERRFINDDGVIVAANTGIPYEFWITPLTDEIYGYTRNEAPIKVSARYCKQWFRPKRAGQFRGICEIGAALNLYGMLRRYDLATLTSAELVALMSLVLKTTTPANDSGTPANLKPFATREFERGMITALPDGWDVYQPRPEQPITPYQMFVECVLRQIGRLLDVPFGIVAGDHSRYNYSSARLDVTGYDERKKFDRNQLVSTVLNPLFYEFLLELSIKRPEVRAVLIGSSIPFGWKFSNRPSIDPLKDANADNIRLQNGSTTYAEVYAARGLDWQEAVAQLGEERKRFAEAGVVVPVNSKNAEPDDTEPDDTSSNPVK